MISPRTASLATSIAFLASFALPGCQTSTDDVPPVTGTVRYDDPVDLPPDATIVVSLEDHSLQDVPAVLITQRTIDDVPGPGVPVPFTLTYAPERIHPARSYAVRAQIRQGGQVLFVTDQIHSVLTRGAPTNAEIVLVRTGLGAKKAKGATVVGTKWQLRSLQGEKLPNGVDAHLRLEPGRDAFRVSGSGGCNRVSGTCTAGPGEAGAMRFGPLAATRMACEQPAMSIEQGLLAALGKVASFELHETYLVLKNASGDQLATFVAAGE